MSRNGRTRLTTAIRQLSLIFRLGIENGKVKSNPAKLLKHKTEDNERVRFLNQFTPSKTEVEYLLLHANEESRLRAVISNHYADHMPEFEIALHTRMRRASSAGSIGRGLIWSVAL